MEVQMIVRGKTQTWLFSLALQMQIDADVLCAFESPSGL
jgi:hypothetical protein